MLLTGEKKTEPQPSSKSSSHESDHSPSNSNSSNPAPHATRPPRPPRARLTRVEGSMDLFNEIGTPDERDSIVQENGESSSSIFSPAPKSNYVDQLIGKKETDNRGLNRHNKISKVTDKKLVTNEHLIYFAAQLKDKVDKHFFVVAPKLSIEKKTTLIKEIINDVVICSLKNKGFIIPDVWICHRNLTSLLKQEEIVPNDWLNILITLLKLPLTKELLEECTQLYAITTNSEASTQQLKEKISSLLSSIENEHSFSVSLLLFNYLAGQSADLEYYAKPGLIQLLNKINPYIYPNNVAPTPDNEANYQSQFATDCLGTIECQEKLTQIAQIIYELKLTKEMHTLFLLNKSNEKKKSKPKKGSCSPEEKLTFTPSREERAKFEHQITQALSERTSALQTQGYITLKKLWRDIKPSKRSHTNRLTFDAIKPEIALQQYMPPFKVDYVKQDGFKYILVTAFAQIKQKLNDRLSENKKFQLIVDSLLDTLLSIKILGDYFSEELFMSPVFVSKFKEHLRYYKNNDQIPRFIVNYLQELIYQLEINPQNQDNQLASEEEKKQLINAIVALFPSKDKNAKVVIHPLFLQEITSKGASSSMSPTHTSSSLLTHSDPCNQYSPHLLGEENTDDEFLEEFSRGASDPIGKQTTSSFLASMCQEESGSQTARAIMQTPVPSLSLKSLSGTSSKGKGASVVSNATSSQKDKSPPLIRRGTNSPLPSPHIELLQSLTSAEDTASTPYVPTLSFGNLPIDSGETSPASGSSRKKPSPAAKKSNGKPIGSPVIQQKKPRGQSNSSTHSTVPPISSVNNGVVPLVVGYNIETVASPRRLPEEPVSPGRFSIFTHTSKSSSSEEIKQHLCDGKIGHSIDQVKPGSSSENYDHVIAELSSRESSNGANKPLEKASPSIIKGERRFSLGHAHPLTSPRSSSSKPSSAAKITSSTPTSSPRPLG